MNFLRHFEFGNYHTGLSLNHPSTTSTSAVDTRAIERLFNKAWFDGDTVEVYFEAFARISSASETLNIELYDDTNGAVIATLQFTGTTSNQRIRSSDLFSSLASGDVKYKARWWVTAGTGNLLQLRLIVKQTATDPADITKSFGRLVLAQYGNTVGTNYSALGDFYHNGLFTYRASEWANTDFILEAIAANGGATTYVDLYDETAASQVSGSELTFTTTTERKVTSALSLVDGHVYRVRTKHAGSTGTVNEVALLFKTDGSGSPISTFVDYIGLWGSQDGNSVGGSTDIVVTTEYDPSNYSGIASLKWFIEATGKTNTGTSNFYLRNGSDSTNIGGVTHDTSYSTQRNSGLSMPGTTKNIWTRYETGGSQLTLLSSWYGVAIDFYAIEKQHTTDSLLKKAATKSHTTDALNKKAFIVSHTADSYVREQPGVPIHVSPEDDAQVPGNSALVFTSSTNTDYAQHFQMQIDTANTFDTGNLIDAKSWLDQTGWEYWDGDSWEQLPQTGLPLGMAGNDVRFTPSSPLSNGVWYRRVRARIMTNDVIGSKQ